MVQEGHRWMHKQRQRGRIAPLCVLPGVLSGVPCGVSTSVFAAVILASASKGSGMIKTRTTMQTERELCAHQRS
ncbi:hypothetical protein RM6536_0043 [Rothia mucilaginosa]|uniref:Uncharacterized protein n=1 Tax=Rothia mucilaginosa TaxID=43675 RepID=A0A0K2RWY2_9MICC|nr:hypothetical protein RM6536_0043 [Rothia mucilaginosa]